MAESAAALAASVCPLVTSSDGGGSIRIPRELRGRIRFEGLPSAGFPVARCITGTTGTHRCTDRRRRLSLTVRSSSIRWPGRRRVIRSRCRIPASPTSQALAEELPAGTRFGVSPDLGYAVVQSDVAACFEDSVKAFETAGHRLVPIEGGPPRMGREWGLLGAFEMAGPLGSYLPEREEEFGRTFIRGVQAADAMTPEIWGPHFRATHAVERVVCRGLR